MAQLCYMSVLNLVVLWLLLRPIPCHCIEKDDIKCLNITKGEFKHSNEKLFTWQFGNSSKDFSCKDFIGIQCDLNVGVQTVVGVNLTDMNLEGSFPEGIKYCVNLLTLDLSGNALSGSIPKDLCTWHPFVTSMDLSGNQLTGNIPMELGYCTYLTDLRLNDNRLSGSIPSELALLDRLKNFSFANNNLSGQIPVKWAGNTTDHFTNNAGLCGKPLSKSCSQKKSSQRLAIILGITGSAILGTVTVCSFVMRNKIPCLIRKKQIALARDNKDAAQIMLFNKEQIVFSLQTLIEATGGFSSNNKIGQGGFGSVYKGVIQDGQEVAVKKLQGRSGQGTTEFMNEVEIVASIQHRNLVNLLGCCVEGDERLLVYEFLPNKSLDTFLFDPMKSRQLDWQKRYDIITGIARGLLYLHQDSQIRIIHRDIKANNILLDEKLNPKIADFGLARLFADNETEIQSRVAGTYGYMAPEYAMRGHLSVKADVYSFGVLLLEIVSGRKNMDMKLLKETQISSLVEWAWTLYKQGNMLIMVDGAVAETCPEEEALRCIQVGLLCTQADADSRPLMSTVVLMITSNSEPLPNPKKPAYVSMGQSPSVTQNPYPTSSGSQNPYPSFTSITVVEAR